MTASPHNPECKCKCKESRSMQQSCHSCEQLPKEKIACARIPSLLENSNSAARNSQGSPIGRRLALNQPGSLPYRGRVALALPRTPKPTTTAASQRPPPAPATPANVLELQQSSGSKRNLEDQWRLYKSMQPLQQDQPPVQSLLLVTRAADQQRKHLHEGRLQNLQVC